MYCAYIFAYLAIFFPSIFEGLYAPRCSLSYIQPILAAILTLAYHSSQINQSNTRLLDLGYRFNKLIRRNKKKNGEKQLLFFPHGGGGAKELLILQSSLTSAAVVIALFRVSSIMTQNSHFLLSDDVDSVSFLRLPEKIQTYEPQSENQPK